MQAMTQLTRQWTLNLYFNMKKATFEHIDKMCRNIYRMFHLSDDGAYYDALVKWTHKVSRVISPAEITDAFSRINSIKIYF